MEPSMDESLVGSRKSPIGMSSTVSQVTQNAPYHMTIMGSGCGMVTMVLRGNE